MANILDLKKFSQKNGEFKITGIFTNKTSGEKFRKAAFCYPGKKPLLVSFGKSIKDSFDLLQDIKKVEKWIYDNLSNIKVAEKDGKYILCLSKFSEDPSWATIDLGFQDKWEKLRKDLEAKAAQETQDEPPF